MASGSITTKNLVWILTEWGKKQIIRLMANPETRLEISYMNVGDNSEGKPQDRDAIGSLMNQVNTRPIPITKKGLASDRPNTVYFTALIEETLCDFDIAELAIYGKVGDEEEMFAVGVGQPIAKPDYEAGYLISIEYTLYIESTNLLDVYDRLDLNPDNEYLTEADVDVLYRTVLYVEGNLAEQISKNTKIIGRGRAEDLNNLIERTRLRYNAASVSTYFSSMVNSVENLENILGFWSFHYTDNYGTRNVIKDFGVYDNSFSTDSILPSYKQEYIGVLSSLNFQNQNYFYVDEMQAISSSSDSIELGELKDYINSLGTYTYNEGDNQWSHAGYRMTVTEFKNGVADYYTKANGVEVTSTQNPPISPITETSLETEENPNGYKFGVKAYAPHTWTFEEFDHTSHTGIWKNELGKVYDIPNFKLYVLDYTGDAISGDIIQLTTTLKPENGCIVTVTGKQLDLLAHSVEIVDNEVVPIIKDSPFTFIASLKHNAEDENNIILAQSNEFTGKHNFRIIKTARNGIKVVLYSGGDALINGTLKRIEFQTIDNIVPTDENYNLIITYEPYDNFEELNPELKVFINNQMYTTSKNNYSYEGMKSNAMPTTSYITSLDSTYHTVNKYHINSQICLMALIKECFPDSIVRCNSLVLNSLCGKNVYYSRV